MFDNKDSEALDEGEEAVVYEEMREEEVIEEEVFQEIYEE